MKGYRVLPLSAEAVTLVEAFTAIGIEHYAKADRRGRFHVAVMVESASQIMALALALREHLGSDLLCHFIVRVVSQVTGPYTTMWWPGALCNRMEVS